MRLNIGCEFELDIDAHTSAVWQITPRRDGPWQLLESRQEARPDVPGRKYADAYGNVCRRMELDPGRFSLRYDALLELPRQLDFGDPEAVQNPVAAVPDDVLTYILPSRYCLSDLLNQDAWNMFGTTRPGWQRVQAICDWVHDNVRFCYGTSSPQTTSADVYRYRQGVCRDFAHLGIALCRAMTIPARYVFGYLPDIDVPPLDAPMDFSAWMEAWLDGRWYTFDPRNNQARCRRNLYPPAGSPKCNDYLAELA